MDFPHYFQTELAYYRGLAREYAARFGEVAHIFGDGGGGSAAQRLLQGAALLTGRLRFRIDDDHPELIQALYQRMWPQHLRSVPAATMVRLSPRGGLSSSRYTVKGGLPIKARPLSGSLPVEANFRTCGPVDVLPLELVEATVDRAHPADLQLRLRFESTGGAALNAAGIERLRLHFLGDDPTRFGLYYWLTRETHAVSVRDGRGHTLMRLSHAHVTSCGYEDEDALMPFVEAPLPGWRLLNEYFILPDKFLGVDVTGLDELPSSAGSALELAFHLGRPQNDRLRVDEENFGLGCAAAMNLGPLQAIEIPLQTDTTAVRLQPPELKEIFSVERVGCRNQDTGKWIEFQPFFAPGRLRLLDDRPCFQLLQLADGVERNRIFLQLTDAHGTPYYPPSDQLKVWVICTDGALPARLPAGAVSQSTAETPENVSIDNPTAVMPPAPLSTERDRGWRQLALYCMHPRDLATANGLNKLIESATIERTGEPPRVLATRAHMTTTLYQRTVVPVRVVTIEIDDAKMQGPGELALFAAVLNRIFARTFDSAVFNQVVVRGSTQGLTLPFAPH